MTKYLGRDIEDVLDPTLSLGEGLSKAKRTVLMAAMPVAKLVALSAPSRAAIFSSKRRVVGFELRL